MYLVQGINNGYEFIINQSGTTNRITGNIQQGINIVDNFTFTIYPNNGGYSFITPFKTKVRVINQLTGKYEFVGRVLNQSNNMDDSGVMSKTFVCESELGYLNDSTQMWGEYKGITVRQYLEALIEKHNLSCPDKKFTVGKVNVFDSNDSIYKYVDYTTTMENIKKDLIETYGGELKLRYNGEERILDYLLDSKIESTTTIMVGKNIKNIMSDIDPTEYITRLVPLGNKLKKEVVDEEGNVTEEELEERLTIAEVNGGKVYLDDIDGINEFGIKEGIIEYDDVSIASNLLRKGQEFLKSQKIKISNSVAALDLSLIGIDIDSFEVGKYYMLKCDPLNINYTVRIIEKNISIESPQDSTITLGDKLRDIKQYQLDMNKNVNKYEKIESQITNQKNIINRFNTQANIRTSETNAKVDEFKNNQSNVNERMNERIEEISKTTSRTTLKSHFVSGTWNGEGTGDCTILQINDKNILIDTGTPEDANVLLSYLQSNNISKLDYVIISHYHNDHIGGLNAEGLIALLNSNISFEDCIFYLPHKNINYNNFVDTVGNGIAARISNSESIIKNKLSELNIQFIQPLNNDKIIFDDNTYIRFLNCDSNTYSVYYNNTLNSGGEDVGYTSYNNFSMVAELNHYNNVFLFTGDIERLSQINVNGYLNKTIDVYKLEHHGVNFQSYEDYIYKVKPQFCFSMNMSAYDPYKSYSSGYFLNNGVSVFNSTENGNSIAISDGFKVYVINEKGRTREPSKLRYVRAPFDLDRGQQIRTYSELNLDNYTRAGVYWCSNSNYTLIVNRPDNLTSGFKLVVMYRQNNESINQMLFDNKNNIHMRVYTQSGWSAWRTI